MIRFLPYLYEVYTGKKFIDNIWYKNASNQTLIKSQHFFLKEKIKTKKKIMKSQETLYS